MIAVSNATFKCREIKNVQHIKESLCVKRSAERLVKEHRLSASHSMGKRCSLNVASRYGASRAIRTAALGGGDENQDVGGPASDINPKIPTSQQIEKYAGAFDFFKIEATIRTWRLGYVTSALIGSGIRGMTSYACKGIGFQKGQRFRAERNQGMEYGEQDFVDKTKIEVVVVKEQVDEVIELISDSVATGEYGDGKIFVLPVIDVVRIRTGEHGFAAERMSGGMSDIKDLSF
eukprot:CAMPEP_0196570720 /NCGR_PEP_ID=MMETSP1081-20130531/881_1 /TAXON_ID=36882 /ORGANISM="Pyramimonas amylifera, Strain CCMP720" /LENGTH=232 /DNA_ID=CAMNT_0041887327 /DNA_START=86 /DNA_END=784 /DNA_ORIENTATION=+